MNRRPLCASPRCWTRDQHWDDCTTEDCKGCLPRQAADDSQLCLGCQRRMSTDVAELPELHDALEHTLAHGTGGGGEKSANKPGSRTPSVAAMETRGRIRLDLVTWARVIVEDQQLATPADTLPDLAAFIGLHQVWLARQEYAGEAADQFADIAIRARAVAYPDRGRIGVGCCVKPDCDGRLWVRVGQDITCDGDSQHRWNATQWHRLGRQLKAAA